MQGYKILYVEDNPDKETVELLFGKHIKAELLNEEIDDWFAFFEQVPAIDYAARLIDDLPQKGALTLLKDNADDYLLFIVDRDLLNGDKELIAPELDKIKTALVEKKDGKEEKIWEGFNPKRYLGDKKLTNSAAYYSGDLIFEYLCLEKRFPKERMIERFRFLTGNPPHDNNVSTDAGADFLLKDFLKTFHYPEAAIQSFVVDKVDGGSIERLQKQINDPVCFHIQYKHEDVLNALRKNKGEIDIDPSGHTKNLIKALAYVEDVFLEGNSEPEPPSIDLLRALLEAFWRTMKTRLQQESKQGFQEKEKTLKKHFRESFLELKKMDPDNDPVRNAINYWFNPSSYLGYHKTNGECVACKEIHANPFRKFKGKSFEFEKANAHYAHIDRLIFSITSQEVHHNDRPRFARYRGQLVVYGICELLLFYQNTIKGDPITPTDKDLQRGKINDLVRFLNKNNGHWIAIDTLNQFSQYLKGINRSIDGLQSLGFEVNGKTKKIRISTEE